MQLIDNPDLLICWSADPFSTLHPPNSHIILSFSPDILIISCSSFPLLCHIFECCIRLFLQESSFLFFFFALFILTFPPFFGRLYSFTLLIHHSSSFYELWFSIFLPKFYLSHGYLIWIFIFSRLKFVSLIRFVLHFCANAILMKNRKKSLFHYFIFHLSSLFVQLCT